MFCSKCGKEISDGTMYCNHCGAPQNADTVPQPQQPKQTQKKNNTGVIVVVVVAVIAIVAGVVFTLPKITGGKNTGNNTTTPTINESINNDESKADNTISQQKDEERSSKEILDDITTSFDNLYDSFSKEFINAMLKIETYEDYEKYYPAVVDLYEAFLTDLDATLKTCEEDSKLYFVKVAEESDNDTAAMEAALESFESILEIPSDFTNKLNEILEEQVDIADEKLSDNEDDEKYDIPSEKISADYYEYINNVDDAVSNAYSLLDELCDSVYDETLKSYPNFERMLNEFEYKGVYL